MEGGSRKDSEEMITAQLELVKIWFSRSGDCPLSLSLTNFFPYSLFLPRFLETAVLHCRRWEYVVLYTPIKHLHLLRGEMPLLRKLVFGPSRFRMTTHIAHEPVEVFTHAPQLKRVTLPQYFRKSAITLPWAQLTHFDGPLCRLSGEDEGMEILRDAPHLVYCRLRIQRSYEKRRPSFSIIHPHLHHFILLAADLDTDLRGLLDNL
ncbi:hypothetical protein B0H19DRAFT_1102958, partial [Mycena capillaripes]